MQPKPLNWTRILEILGIFSIVGSLIFVGLQMKQDREIAAAENVMLVVSDRREWAALLAENGEIWLAGNSGTSLTGKDELTYRSLAEVLELRYYSAWFRNQRVPGGNPAETFAYLWAQQAVENPGLMQYWRELTEEMALRYERLGLEGQPANLWHQTVNEYIDELAHHN